MAPCATLNPRSSPRWRQFGGFATNTRKRGVSGSTLALGPLPRTRPPRRRDLAVHDGAAKLASTGHNRLQQGQSNQAQQTSGASHNWQSMNPPGEERGRRLEINCQFIACDTGVSSTPESDNHKTRRLPCIERQPCRRVECLRRIGTASILASSATSRNQEAT